MQYTSVGSVDNSKLGDNVITFNVSDSSGNAAASVQRKVTVIDTTGPEITIRGQTTMLVEVNSLR